MNNPVVIAGAGPVGLLLACELRLLGVETVVLERLAHPREESLGSALNAGTVEILDQREVMAAIRADGFEWPLAMFAGYPLDPAALPERHSSTLIVGQSNVERRLAQYALKLGAEIRRGQEITGLLQRATGVEVTVRETATGRSSTVAGRYLVGCDGSDSTVRTLAGIAFTGEELPFHGLIGDLEVEPGDELMQHLGPEQTPFGPYMLSPVGENVLRIALGEFGAEPPSREQEPTLAELRALAERMTGRPMTTGRTRWLLRWYNVNKQAEQYRKGDVFLAGDAAHVQFPLSGMALYSGLEDAINLGWKLAAAVTGQAGQALLDSYHAERHPVGARSVLTSRAQVALTHPVDRIGPLRELFGELVKLPEVNSYLVELSCGLGVTYPGNSPEVPGHPLLGRRLVNAELVTEQGPTTVARTLHPARGVLLDLSDGTVALPDLAGWQDRVRVVTAEPAAEIAAPVVLLRPDGRVAWAGPLEGAKEPDAGLRAALSTWFGAPLPVPTTAAAGAK
ncbi:FAD-dependent monooxygenase [Kitasatospora sp. NPDC008050]|uniref:FAD-dependent monooxygenase n=1 Tax=Kitasatospora sp. NPDC008050 TaxID=3364021 RepID=UPI0036F0BA7C